MENYFIKSQRTLELPAVLEMLAEECVCEKAGALARSLAPSADKNEIERRLGETDAAKKMMSVRGTPSVLSCKDVGASLQRADLGGALNTIELLDIAKVLQCARLVKAYISAKDNVGSTPIDYLFSALQLNKQLEESITTSIVGEDEIADSASAELTSIRRKKRAAAASARESLNKIISSPSYAKALQEQIITSRGGRFVVPVKAEYKNLINGLVHDTSASGATLFIEPMACVKANNQLKELESAEKKEIERILYLLSAKCAECSEQIITDYDIICRLDLIFAKAKLSYKLECDRAELSSDGKIVLNKARHPLIDPAKVVPITLDLADDIDTLIITGPNTGGKTVTLKTIGLFALMNQCGLHVPASFGTSLPVFSCVLADIGDEQSIEQSLSTFSAHMKNITEILEICDETSLLLFDELGAGTDPVEGAALAISIIEYARSKGAIIAATTHYAELKVYATNCDGIENASCEFNVETLCPTYKLLVGIPGKSNAFAIARRLGLDESIINDAGNRISTDSASFEATIERLEQSRTAFEKERAELNGKIKEAEEDRKKAARLRAELQVRLDKAGEKAKKEAEQIIKDAREEAEQVFKELDRMKREAEQNKSNEEINEERAALMKKLRNHENEIRSAAALPAEEKKSTRLPKIGDTVELLTMGGAKGTVTGISADGELTVTSGLITITVNTSDVYVGDQIPDTKKKDKAASGVQARLRNEAVVSELDLRGLDTSEAVLYTERFLDSSAMSKVKTVRIIHGKGTGALRSAVQNMLKRNKLVKSYRLGTFGEGESGVTIVELK